VGHLPGRVIFCLSFYNRSQIFAWRKVLKISAGSFEFRQCCYEVLWWFRDCQWSAVRQSLLLRPGWHGSLAVVSASTNDSSIIANYFILIYFIYCYWFPSCCCSSFIRSTFVVASTVDHLSSTHHSIHSGIFFINFFFSFFDLALYSRQKFNLNLAGFWSFEIKMSDYLGIL
jgi:hypothetical protein